MNYLVGNTKDRVVNHDDVLLMFIGSVCTGGGPSYCLLIKHYNKIHLYLVDILLGLFALKPKIAKKETPKYSFKFSYSISNKWTHTHTWYVGIGIVKIQLLNDRVCFNRGENQMGYY